MANRILSISLGHVRGIPPGPALLAGVAATVAHALTATPASAQTPAICNGLQTVSVTIKQDGKDTAYTLCAKSTSYANAKNELEATPWFKKQNIAQKLANALYSSTVYDVKNPDPSISQFSWVINKDPANNNRADGPYFLTGVTGNGQKLNATAYQKGRSGYYCPGNNDGVNASCNITDLNQPLVYLFGFDPSPASAPAPLPLLGAGAAFGWSRRLRRRLKGRPSGLGHDACGPSDRTLAPLRPVGLVPAPAPCVLATSGGR